VLPPTPHPRRILFVALCLLVLLGLSVGFSLDAGLPSAAQGVALPETPLAAAREAPMNNRAVGVRPRTLEETPTDTPTATLTPTATPSQTPTATPTEVAADKRTYLPLLLRQLPLPATPTPTATPTGTPTPPVSQGIYGWVTFNGAPAANVTLAMRFYNGSAWSTAAMTATDLDGRYVFTDAPTLLSGQTYYVRFGFNTTNPQYLYAWYGPDITAYAAGSTAAGGDFDIANISMLWPDFGARMPIPVDFFWQRRNLDKESYRWMLVDPVSGTRWTSGDLGDVGSFTLNALPTGVTVDKVYRWYVDVYSGPQNRGTSFYYRDVTFLQGSTAESKSGPVPQMGSGPRDLTDTGPAREGPKQ
jgi:hypothetical protein